MQVVRFAQSPRNVSNTVISSIFKCSTHFFSLTGPLAGQVESPRCFGGSNACDGAFLTELCSSAGGAESQLCGRGDKRTKRGKRFKGSFGNCRHRKSWENSRLREKWEIPSGPAPGSLLPRPFPPLLERY